jgi:hypothetical protein
VRDFRNAAIHALEPHPALSVYLYNNNHLGMIYEFDFLSAALMASSTVSVVLLCGPFARVYCAGLAPLTAFFSLRVLQKYSHFEVLVEIFVHVLMSFSFWVDRTARAYGYILSVLSACLFLAYWDGLSVSSFQVRLRQSLPRPHIYISYIRVFLLSYVLYLNV